MLTAMFSVQIELLDTVALNLHRIDKDVQRCDRNYYYFNTANLEKLRNIMCRCVGHILTSLTLPSNVACCVKLILKTLFEPFTPATELKTSLPTHTVEVVGSRNKSIILNQFGVPGLPEIRIGFWNNCDVFSSL